MPNKKHFSVLEILLQLSRRDLVINSITHSLFKVIDESSISKTISTKEYMRKTSVLYNDLASIHVS